MNTPSLSVNKSLAALGQILQRMEQSGRAVDADQYRTVVARLEQELKAVRPDASFEAVLQALPAVAELYENVQYAHAGLCRSPLDAAMRAEMQARGAIESARAAH